MSATPNIPGILKEVGPLANSLAPLIKEFVKFVEQRQATKLFLRVSSMLDEFEEQRSVIFGDGSVFAKYLTDNINNIRSNEFTFFLSKFNGTFKAVQRMMKRYDAENDQVALATQLYKDATKLMLLMNGDGVDEQDIFKLGAFYKFTGEKRPDDPFFVRLKYKMIRFVRPLHSTEAEPEFEEYNLVSNWEDVKKELNWDEFKKDSTSNAATSSTATTK